MGRLPVVVLGIDPGTENGAALIANDVLVESWGTTITRAKRDFIVREARTRAAAQDQKLVAVVETWTQHGKWSFKAALSCGEQAGRWLDALEEQRVPYVRVEPMVWRRGIWKVGRNVKTEVWEQMAANHCNGMFHVKQLSHDTNAAICMAWWGTRAEKVKLRLGL